MLIGSRTGVSDTSGICTVHMPDTLVVCFTLNYQSIKGAFAVAQSVREQRPDIRSAAMPERELAEPRFPPRRCLNLGIGFSIRHET